MTLQHYLAILDHIKFCVFNSSAFLVLDRLSVADLEQEEQRFTSRKKNASL